MDIEKQTAKVTLKEDALLKNKSEENINNEVIDCNKAEKMPLDVEISKDTQKENSDLLKKIEEIVQDESQEEFCQSPEQDFLKKLDEIETIEALEQKQKNVPAYPKENNSAASSTLDVSKQINDLSKKDDEKLGEEKQSISQNKIVSNVDKLVFEQNVNSEDNDKRNSSVDSKDDQDQKDVKNGSASKTIEKVSDEVKTQLKSDIDISKSNETEKHDPEIVKEMEIENMSVDPSEDDSNENAMDIDMDVDVSKKIFTDTEMISPEDANEKDQITNKNIKNIPSDNIIDLTQSKETSRLVDNNLKDKNPVSKMTLNKNEKEICTKNVEIEKPKKNTTKQNVKQFLDNSPTKTVITENTETTNDTKRLTEKFNETKQLKGNGNHLTDSTDSLNSTTEEHIKLCAKNIDLIDDRNIEKECNDIHSENKLLLHKKEIGRNTSLDKIPVKTANVFNSTPIEKQFEISSENVSKISEVADGNQSEKNIYEDHDISSKSCQLTSSKKELTTSETDTCTTNETDQTSDAITNYINALKQNGNTDSDSISLKDYSANVKKTESQNLTPNPVHKKYIDLIPKKDSVYEINIHYEENDINFLSVEKMKTSKSNIGLNSTSGGDSIEKSSSSGSALSLQQFVLPAARVSEMSSGSSSSSSSQRTLDGKFVIPSLVITSQPNKSKHTIKGIVDLCTFMIDHFTKIKQNINNINESDSMKSSKSNVQENSQEFSQTTSPVDKRAQKRQLTKTEDDDSKPKNKYPKKSQTTKPNEIAILKNSENTRNSLIGCSVLAKWVDKKFYAGKIFEEKSGNKFVILFEDGASKTLPKESIVFGQDDILPLKDHSIYALVGDDFEYGTVTSFKKVDGKVIYTVQTETNTVHVTASDIYLQDDQAKKIQNLNKPITDLVSLGKDTDAKLEKISLLMARTTRNKRTSGSSPSTPEAGFSGGVLKKGGRRQKRIPALDLTNRISESSDISDSPATPESALEAIEGVQPELQRTLKDAEVSQLIVVSDYIKDNPEGNIEDILGQLPTSSTLFKNKNFLLTCTIKGKSSNPSNMEYSKIPFMKSYLQKQLETGGAKVYSHFEDIPKNKYKQCKLISARPCVTAKYVQCLAADIQAISHQWVIDSCNSNSLIDMKTYLLPAGWSILTNQFIRWSIGKASDQRQSNKPFSKQCIIIASEHRDFVTFWSRVCKLSGGTIRYVKSLNDVTSSTTGYMVTEDDFCDNTKAKARHFGIPVVSTVWVVQSLFLGKICPPNSHEKLSQIYQDDDL